MAIEEKIRKKETSEYHALKTQWGMNYFVIKLDDKALCVFFLAITL